MTGGTSPATKTYTVTVTRSEPAPGEDTCGATLGGDETVNGSCASDCESQVDGRGYARYHTFTLAQQSPVTINLASDVDTYLYLREGEARSGAVLHENDDIENGVNLNSRISATMASGTYTIEATTYNAATAGAFTLTVAGIR